MKKTTVAILIGIISIIILILAYQISNSKNPISEDKITSNETDERNTARQLLLEEINKNYLKCKTAMAPTCIALMRTDISICDQAESEKYDDFFSFTKWNRSLEKIECKNTIDMRLKYLENQPGVPQRYISIYSTLDKGDVNGCYDLAREGIMVNVNTCLALMSKNESRCGYRCDQQYYLQSLSVYDFDASFCNNFVGPEKDECIRVLNEKILS